MKIYLFLFLLTGAFLGQPAALRAQTPPPSAAEFSTHDEPPQDPSPAHPEDSSSEEPGGWWSGTNQETYAFQKKFFNMLIVLGALVAFMLVASWSLKRMMKSRITQLNAGSRIKVLETRYLSPRATLYLIEVQDEVLLIGESPTAMAHLAKIGKTGNCS